MLTPLHLAPLTWRLVECLGLTLALGLMSGCAARHQTYETHAGVAQTFRLNFNNAHLLMGPSGGLLIDAGLEGDVEALIEELKSNEIALESIKAIVITHGHADHAGGAAQLKALTGAQIIAGAGDRPMLASGRNDDLCPTDRLSHWEKSKHQSATYTGFSADIEVDGTYDLTPLLGTEVTVHARPGHTPGSVVVTAGDAAFVGDLFRGGILGWSAETHFYMCDLDANLADIQWLLGDFPKTTRYFTGHFGPVSRGALEEYAAEEVARRHR